MNSITLKRPSHPTASCIASQLPKPPSSKVVEVPGSTRPFHVKSSSSISQSFVKASSSSKSIERESDNSTRDTEPATNELPSEIHDDFFQADADEHQVVTMLHKITKRSERNHLKYDSFRNNILERDKRINELQASFEEMATLTAGLEHLCSSTLDTDTLDELFHEIPIQQRKTFFGE